MKKLPITRTGYERLVGEIKYLREEKKPSTIQAVSSARDLGDLSENAEYHEARRELSFIEGKIINLEDILAKSEVIDTQKLCCDTVKFGAFVTIENQEDDSVFIYQLVSDYESSISDSRISISSPIGRSVMNKKVGDYIEVNLPSGEKVFKILNIDFKQ